jgi:diadenosine tetraphosphatase ApaH/serine/threonine PP2A family protein phosphatase
LGEEPTGKRDFRGGGLRKMMACETRGRLAVVREDFRGEILVAGDLHGDLEAFKGVRELFLSRPGSMLIFLGDYADRGPHGLEVVGGLKELMEEQEGVLALKGNHEDYRGGLPYFSPCDLMDEVEAKRGVRWTDYFPEFERDFLDRLHLAVLIQGLAVLVHGGISSKIRKVGDLEDPSAEVEEDVLWSDPWEEEGERPNPRGAGVLFGPDVSEAFTRRLGVKFLIRSHEPAKALLGPHVAHSGRVFTISSTRVYGGKAFVLSFKPDPALTGEDLRGQVEEICQHARGPDF